MGKAVPENSSIFPAGYNVTEIWQKAGSWIIILSLVKGKLNE